MKRLTNEEGRKLLAKKARRKAGADKAHLWIEAWNKFSGPDDEGVEWKAEYGFYPGRRWRLDWAYIGRRVAVEVDGGRWAPGGGKHGSDADRDKLNHAAATDWAVFRFSPQQLKADPEACVRLVGRAL